MKAFRPLALIPLALMAAGVVAWLWPIGVGGRMPVGGDVTQFQFGLMAFYDRALAHARLPFWNDLWGFGFPGLAESQMGVYYPPHLVLYGLLSAEAAYTASFVLHTIWAALGSSWAARRFGASRGGAALAGFVFAGSGFFVIHVTHQWGYTVGSWMPWAWGLGWTLIRGEGRRRSALTLAALLAIQVLPGHFQLAFITQLGLVVLAICGWFDGRSHRGGLLVLLALGLALPLAALQLGPTWRLARLAESGRGWDYLAGFAASPAHLVSYLAPGLFHRSPLWRPLAWDPFHTSPEEHLGYVGLAPLFLALGAIGSGFRRDRAVRAVSMIGLVSLLLSLGPYVPGFDLIIRLPGFSFFRAPARWGLATMLALALLAGLGFDRLPTWTRPGRSLARFSFLAVWPIVLALLAIELALASTDGPGWPAVADAFERARSSLPWEGDPHFRDVMTSARRPSGNPIVLSALARRGIAPNARFDRLRFAIYIEELGETTAILAALLALGLFGRRPRSLAVGLVAMTVVDLLILGHHRDLETAPIRPLTEQSNVLGRLATEPRGLRTLDGLGNFPMTAGAAPLRAYRTLDLPALVPLVGLAAESRDPGLALRAARAVGAGVRIAGATEPPPEGPGWQPTEIVDDPALASWAYGPAWVAEHPAYRRFTLTRPEGEPARAWLTSAIVPGNDSPNSPDSAISTVDAAQPLESRAPIPERFEVAEFVAEGDGPNLVVVSILYDPQWTARWVGSDGAVIPAAVERVFASDGLGGWMAVTVPNAGRWRLILEYDARAERNGLLASAPAWALWLAAFAWPVRRRESIEERTVP